MKDCVICVRMLLVRVMLVLPCFSIASWQGDACSQSTGCEQISQNYTVPYCVNGDIDHSSCTWSLHANNLSDIVNNLYHYKDVYDLVENYCSTFFGDYGGRIYFSKPSHEVDSWDWQQTFDSRQSLFLYALCGSFKKDGNMPFINSNASFGDAYKGDIVKALSLQQISDKNDLCSLEKDASLQNCDLSIYATKIFEGIMSDLFKIEYAHILRVEDSKDFNTKETVESFMNSYLGINDEYKKIKKDYSKTISILEADQKSYKNVIDKMKIIDNSKLANLAKKSGCKTDKQVTGIDFVACALHSSQGRGSTLSPAFLTLIYNELLHYQEFLIYYTKWLDSKVHQSGVKSLTSDQKLNYAAIITDFESYSSIQKEAFKLAQRNLEDFSMSYPLHIWMLLYIEKVEKFRNDFTNVVTIFYSLSEKLQNVQLPS